MTRFLADRSKLIKMGALEGTEKNRTKDIIRKGIAQSEKKGGRVYILSPEEPPVPKDFKSFRITVGGEDEGYCYASSFKAAWKKVPGALEWLKAETGKPVSSAAGILH